MTPNASRLARLFGAGASLWCPPPYPLLAACDGERIGHVPGIYAVWHLGVRPRWLRIGGTADLAATLAYLRGVPALTTFVPAPGAYVAWAQLALEKIPAAAGALVRDLVPAAQHIVVPGEIAATANAGAGFPLPPGSGAPPR